jgi:hypothetical protein
MKKLIPFLLITLFLSGCYTQLTVVEHSYTPQIIHRNSPNFYTNVVYGHNYLWGYNQRYDVLYHTYQYRPQTHIIIHVPTLPNTPQQPRSIGSGVQRDTPTNTPRSRSTHTDTVVQRRTRTN